MLKLKLKKWIGSWFGIWCPECGSRLVSTGYDDKEKCTNPLCITNKKMYGITNVIKTNVDLYPDGLIRDELSKGVIVKRKRGRPKKSKL